MLAAESALSPLVTHTLPGEGTINNFLTRGVARASSRPGPALHLKIVSSSSGWQYGVVARE